VWVAAGKEGNGGAATTLSGSKVNNAAKIKRKQKSNKTKTN
jgi:hypothetical protein